MFRTLEFKVENVDLLASSVFKLYLNNTKYSNAYVYLDLESLEIITDTKNTFSIKKHVDEVIEVHNKGAIEKMSWMSFCSLYKNFGSSYLK